MLRYYSSLTESEGGVITERDEKFILDRVRHTRTNLISNLIGRIPPSPLFSFFFISLQQLLRKSLHEEERKEATAENVFDKM